MSLTVTQRPQITYEGEDSTWNALRNPVVYKMQRKDYVFNQINNNGGNIQLQFNAVDVTASFAIGQTIRVQSDNLVYDGFGTVTAESYAGNSLITINIPYVSAAPGGFANNLTTRLNYRVEVEVYNLANELLNSVPFYSSPDRNGYLLIDVSKILKAYVLPSIDIDLTGTTKVFEDNAYTGFYIKYRERWTGSAESQTNDSSNQFYVNMAAMQILAENGGNLGPYAIPSIQFLTKLDRVVMWRGYPALLAAVINEDVSSDIYLETGEGASTPEDHAGEQVIFDLNQIITDQTVDEVDAVIYENTSVPSTFSEEQNVVLRDPCENPVMLMGRNSLGGVMQWLFDVNQEVSYENNDGVKVKRMRLFAEDLLINEWEALQDFIGLGEVYKNTIRELLSTTIQTATRVGSQVYVLYPDGKKIGVIVTAKVKSTDTRQLRHSFEVDIEYPELFA
jgi:hypothetical protein